MPSSQSSQSSGLSSPPSSQAPSPGAAPSPGVPSPDAGAPSPNTGAPSPPLSISPPGREPAAAAPRLRLKVSKSAPDAGETAAPDSEDPRAGTTGKSSGKAAVMESGEEAGGHQLKGKGRKKVPVDEPKKRKRKRIVVDDDEGSSSDTSKPDTTDKGDETDVVSPPESQERASQADEPKAEESPKKKPRVMPKKRPAGAAGPPTTQAGSPASVQARKPKPPPKAPPKAAPRTSLLASTLSKLSSQPDKPVAKPAERARPGAWTDDFALTAEQEQQYAASLVARTKAVAARAAEYPLKMQAAKDAYRADHAINGQRRAINVQGAMGIQTAGLPSRMVQAVLAGNVNSLEPKK
ncbi:hypothetical protein CspeluHIS016_0103260 [Cutaneotrichosporon spelunceum]|uniref:Uncharacterized protein n=1 Tax=Cutaneotrichosporon spelunceum TaxID=1672016 RepID=A0AAD3TNW3_9TREE|nr:hypothetical protein CspeluHIS016_0103260 [Cutaneotrichosporon spelunceum]